MKRSVGQHHAQSRQTGCNVRQQLVGFGFFVQQHDGAFRALQPGGLFFADMAERADGFHVQCHDGQRFAGAVFELAQPRHRRRAGCVADQMEAAQAFHRYAATHIEDLHRAHDGVAVQALAKAVGQLQLGAAHRAGGGFGVKAAAVRVKVFLAADGTQRKGQHAGVGAVVGQPVGDGVARPAIGAVDEGKAVAAVARGEQFFHAARTSGYVRRQPGVGDRAAAFFYLKALFGIAQRNIALLQRVDVRQRRQAGSKRLAEGAQRLRLALQFQRDAFAAVSDKAGEAALAGRAPDEGTEADALNPALNR